MSEIQRLYEEMAKLVIGFGPFDAKCLVYSFIVRADASEDEGGVYQHEFEYINQNNEVDWSEDDASDITDSLTALALKLRSHVESESMAKWKSMRFQIDMERQSFKVDFSYE